MSAPVVPDADTYAIDIGGLGKRYASGHEALRDIDLRVRGGEIFALLGPNGAGKTTLISIICGIVKPGQGRVRIQGFDIVSDFRRTRALIGLVPQELSVDVFLSPWATASFSRGLFGLPPNPAHIERVLRSLSLWDKRNAPIVTLSGGMKRRVLIAKALAHEPSILFLDEPTAGVDVDLRRDMWRLIRELRASGVTIVLTTHYIEEAEEMADRVGIMHNGRLILVEDKIELMRKLGNKRLILQLQTPLDALPSGLAAYRLEHPAPDRLIFTTDAETEPQTLGTLLNTLARQGIHITDIDTRQSTLEDIFLDLVNTRP
ncbi:ABC transporter ATP-binding protein [Acidihalobacter ferrooxydans]|uniref:Multidrug ABC transporter ATP-binding protein n=1 Tax=Acidihalobacter ferrooxydans TaxID=1765967 RepID=A0A1P8UJY4_9GAMM|nr:ABC transporter ATP-binding protein [Acidihalobacter ferrooxydans]APZ44149.1 multidrug ABC transporter ATP-binding protein [Acidihalobacter ferrooxydans]